VLGVPCLSHTGRRCARTNISASTNQAVRLAWRGPGPKNLLAVGKGDVNPLADRVWIFTFKRQNIGQKGPYARVGHRALPFCPLPSDPLNNTLSGSWRAGQGVMG